MVMQISCPGLVNSVDQGVAFRRTSREYVSFTIHCMITSFHINIERQDFTAGQHDGSLILIKKQNKLAATVLYRHQIKVLQSFRDPFDQP